MHATLMLGTLAGISQPSPLAGTTKSTQIGMHESWCLEIEMKQTLYRNYLLVVLLVILAFNYVDRLALGLLLQNIKVDLSLSDTQLGILSGIAFTLFYAVMGIPIARWADRGNRVTIIALTTGIWSAMVALCGLAGSFAQLLLIRVGVAVGEAGCIPPAHSLIADYFSRSERPRAVSIYMLGGPLSVVIGYFFAGWLNQEFGWRLTFLLLGLPGLALAALVRWTLHDPRELGGRHNVAVAASVPVELDCAAPGPAPSSLRQVFIALWANITFRHLMLGFAVMSFLSSGIWHWAPSFFIRSYGLETTELGIWFAVTWGLGGLAGTYWGGELATRHAAQNEAKQLKVMAIVYGSFAIVTACIYLSRDRYVAILLMALAAVGSATVTGPLFAVIQTVVEQRMRATSIAIIYLVANLIGMGLGPLAAGALSDALHPHVGDESLRYALVALCPAYFWAGWHLWRASKTVSNDLRAARAAQANGPQLSDDAEARANA